MFESIWKAVFDKKQIHSALNYWNLARNPPIPQFLSFFDWRIQGTINSSTVLPRLYWPVVDFLISESVSNNNQITIPAAVLQEISTSLNPIPNDRYYDPVESEPFTGNLINPRFHRLIEILDRWKSAGIPIKGSQTAKALEETFKKFLPTDAMMESFKSFYNP